MEAAACFGVAEALPVVISNDRPYNRHRRTPFASFQSVPMQNCTALKQIPPPLNLTVWCLSLEIRTGE